MIRSDMLPKERVHCNRCGRFCKPSGDPLFMTVYYCDNHEFPIVVHCVDAQDPTLKVGDKVA